MTCKLLWEIALFIQTFSSWRWIKQLKLLIFGRPFLAIFGAMIDQTNMCNENYPKSIFCNKKMENKNVH